MMNHSTIGENNSVALEYKVPYKIFGFKFYTWVEVVRVYWGSCFSETQTYKDLLLEQANKKRIERRWSYFTFK